jgi:hypothetical protein
MKISSSALCGLGWKLFQLNGRQNFIMGCQFPRLYATVTVTMILRRRSRRGREEEKMEVSKTEAIEIKT